MERGLVLNYFWQEFAAVEMSTDMTLGDMFDVSVWVHKLCGSLCELFLASASVRPSQYDLNTEAANILGFVFNIYRCKMNELSLNLETDLHWVHYETQRDIEILKHIKKLQEILIENKINPNAGFDQSQPPYTLCRYKGDIHCDQDLGHELSHILQFITIKTQLTLRQLAFLRLKIINPILYEKQRTEKIGLFKPADSSSPSSETELEPPSKKSKI
jgi:hypothetical protein